MLIKKLLILALIPFMLCSCALNKNNINQETITFSSWGSVTEVKIIEKILSDFEKENPSIKVNFLHIPQNYFQKIHLLFASNQAPDVIFINNLYLPVYESQLEDLSNFINKEEYYNESLKALSYKDKILAIPRDISNLVFYRNKNIIKKTPQNLEELMSAIEDCNKFGISFERDIYYMFPYVLTMEEDIFAPQKSLNFYKNLEGKYAPTPAQIGSSTLAQMFLDEKIGLYLSGRWIYPKITEKAKFEWDVIPFCGIVPMDASGWAISKTSKHKESSKKLIQYLSSEKSSKYFLDTGLIVPARIKTSQQIDNKQFLNAINKSKAITINKNYKKFVDNMNKDFFN